MPLCNKPLQRKEEKIIFEKYRIDKCISNHSDSVVWVAEHIFLRQKRIIKGIRHNSPVYHKLIDEAHLMKNLKHPNIPEIYDLDQDEEFTYIIEQYIPGVSLAELCKNKLLSLKEICQFIIQISSTIDYLHSLPERIIHLDIKPENIIVHDNRCYLIDFGCARTKDTDDICGLGSISYAAPEQFSGEGTSIESDIYSLGMLLRYLTEHGSASKAESDQLNKIASGCTKKKFWNRIGTATELINRVSRLQKITEVQTQDAITIAVAGASSNNGATYISLLLSGFLAETWGDCSFIETKDSDLGEYLCSSPFSQRLAQIKHINSKQYERGDFPNGSMVIDYGLLDTNMPEDFYEADCACIVLGKMAWEKADLIRSRALSQRCRNRIFLINPSDSVPEELALFLKEEKFQAFPFVNSPESIYTDHRLMDIISDILSKCKKT